MSSLHCVQEYAPRLTKVIFVHVPIKTLIWFKSVHLTRAALIGLNCSSLLYM